MIASASARRAGDDTHDRVRAPNARPRIVAVVGLGDGGARCVASLDVARMPHVQVARLPSSVRAASQRSLEAIAGDAGDFAAAIAQADLVFAVATPGDDVGQAAAVARLAHGRNLMLTGVVLGAEGDDADCDALRHACDILVVSSDRASLEGMLDALGSP